MEHLTRTELVELKTHQINLLQTTEERYHSARRREQYAEAAQAASRIADILVKLAAAQHQLEKVW